MLRATFYFKVLWFCPINIHLQKFEADISLADVIITRSERKAELCQISVGLDSQSVVFEIANDLNKN